MIEKKEVGFEYPDAGSPCYSIGPEESVLRWEAVDRAGGIGLDSLSRSVPGPLRVSSCGSGDWPIGGYRRYQDCQERERVCVSCAFVPR